MEDKEGLVKLDFATQTLLAAALIDSTHSNICRKGHLRTAQQNDPQEVSLQLTSARFRPIAKTAATKKTEHTILLKTTCK